LYLLTSLTDSNKNKVQEYIYTDAYSSTTQTQTINTNNPYAYTDKKLDDTDLYYYRARYYDPTTQRFLSQDPIGFASGDFNFYRYVGNSPGNFTDPFGLINDPVLNGLNSLTNTLGKITHGLGHDIPKAFKGFSNGLKKLDNYADTCQDDSLSSNLFNYLYLNGQRSFNESETPINLIDKFSTYNTINDALSGNKK